MYMRSMIVLSLFLLLTAVPGSSADAAPASRAGLDSSLRDAILTELMLDGGVPRQSVGIAGLNGSDFDSGLNRMLSDGRVKPDTKQKIEQLRNGEVFRLTIGADGALLEATSSKHGDIRAEIEKQPAAGRREAAVDSAFRTTPLGSQGSSSGRQTGAYHRLQTPASGSTIYNGLVADSLTFPGYPIAEAYNQGEAAYLYAGIDGIAEVGFAGIISQITPAGWYPVFHARVTHQLERGDDNGNLPLAASEYTYVHRSKRYRSGDTVSGYKVYYYSTDKNLTIREQINYSDVYIVTFLGQPSTGRSVKRVTALAMNRSASASSSYHYSFTTPAVWRNMRFLINNSADVLYPDEIPGLADDVWLHGGRIEYLSNHAKDRSRIESYRFLKETGPA